MSIDSSLLQTNKELVSNISANSMVMMAPPFPTCSQLFQPYYPQTNVPFFTTKATNDNSSNNISIQPTNNLVDFKDKPTGFKIKTLVKKITSLSTSQNKPESLLLQILHKHAATELQTISDFNHLLRALLIAKKTNLCQTIFTNLSSFHLVSDSCTYCIMIRCHCQKNELEDAKNVLFTLLENGFVPDSATITVLINSLCKRGKVKKAMEVFGLMGRKGLKLGVQQHNCLLKGLSYVGRVDEAVEILKGMKENEFGVDVYSYNAVMNGLCKVGRSDEAMDLFNEAVEIGLIPNVVTFNTLIQGYAIEGRTMESVGVLNSMKKHGCVADCISYSTVLRGLLKWDEIVEALGVYRDMVEIGFEVDLRMMGALVRRLCRRSLKVKWMVEDAYEVFEKMKERGLGVDKRTVEVMVEALCKGEMFDEALVNLNDMGRWGYSLEGIDFEKGIEGLCGKGRVDEAVETLLLLHANGGSVDRGSFDVLINELNLHGRVFCASFLFGFALKQGVVLVLNKEPLQADNDSNPPGVSGGDCKYNIV